MIVYRRGDLILIDDFLSEFFSRCVRETNSYLMIELLVYVHIT